MNFAEADLEALRLAHERLRAEHAALVAISEQNTDARPSPAVHRAHLDRLREHRARLQSHRAALRAAV